MLVAVALAVEVAPGDGLVVVVLTGVGPGDAVDVPPVELLAFGMLELPPPPHAASALDAARAARKARRSVECGIVSLGGEACQMTPVSMHVFGSGGS